MPAEAPAGREIRACPGAATCSAYLGLAGGDARIALRRAIADALSDLMEADRRLRAAG